MPGSTDTNKVEFGISNLYIGTYTDTNGTVTLGTPYHQKGAVNLSLEPDGDDNDFYADNVKYWSGFSDNGFTGEIEVAKFDLEAKKQFFGYVQTTGRRPAGEKSHPVQREPRADQPRICDDRGQQRAGNGDLRHHSHRRQRNRPDARLVPPGRLGV